MNEHEVYEKWKTQRTLDSPTPDFTERVMSEILDDQSQAKLQPRTSERFASRYAAAITAVVAASLLGILRVTFALLIGIINL